MFQYRFYGANLAIDTALAAIAVSAEPANPLDDKCVRLVAAVAMPDAAELPFAVDSQDDAVRAVSLTADGPPGSESSGQRWRFGVAGVVVLTWTTGSDIIEYQIEASCPQPLFTFWVVHVFFPLYLALQRGAAFLHAVAVEIEEKAIIFAAPSFGGKSTLGEYFLRRGHAMLADDKVAIRQEGGRFMAQPAHAFHRPHRELETLGRPIPNRVSRSLPVAAVYVLERGAADSTPVVERLVGAAAFQALLPHHLYAFNFFKQTRFEWLGQFLDHTSVFRLQRPWDLNLQHLSYSAIVENQTAVG